jgi:hypothetical protein
VSGIAGSVVLKRHGIDVTLVRQFTNRVGTVTVKSFVAGHEITTSVDSVTDPALPKAHVVRAKPTVSVSASLSVSNLDRLDGTDRNTVNDSHGDLFSVWLALLEQTLPGQLSIVKLSEKEVLPHAEQRQ